MISNASLLIRKQVKCLLPHLKVYAHSEGLVNNAVVKITELNGRLVYQTKALGGQAVWNGRNYKGIKVSSGAYLVLVTDDTNKEKLVTNIFIVK